MEPAYYLPVLKFLHFFLASLQAKTAGISKLVDDIKLVPSFKLQTKYLYDSFSLERKRNCEKVNLYQDFYFMIKPVGRKNLSMIDSATRQKPDSIKTIVLAEKVGFS